jgi:PadR family transcriptional regulator PadR
MAPPRITSQSLKILTLLAADPAAERYGLELAREARVQHGTTYPILKRFLDAGWLESRPEEVDPAEAGRPRQRLYRLTAVGMREADRVLAEHHIVLPPAASAPKPEPAPEFRRPRGSNWRTTPSGQVA